jgi:hypothetical protein
MGLNHERCGCYIQQEKRNEKQIENILQKQVPLKTKKLQASIVNGSANMNMTMGFITIRRHLFCRICQLAVLISMIIFLGAMPGAAQPHLEFLPGVSENARTTITRGIEQTELFFSDRFGVTLPKRLNIVVAPNQAVFAKILERLCRYGSSEAAEYAKMDAGVTCPGGIALNGGMQDLQTLFFVACHELVHKYQGAVSPGDRERDIYWLLEGTATAVAAYMADITRVESMQESREEYLGRFRKASGRPSLKELRSSTGHNTARKDYGGQITYTVETWAALELAWRKGIQSTYNYFLNLKRNKDSARVFEMTFGTRLDTFEKEFEQDLGRALHASYSADPLGRVWKETEDMAWSGIYTRRGNSTVFDAAWSNDKSSPVTGIIAMHLSGDKVFIESHQQSNGRKYDYLGTLSRDSRTISGTFWRTDSMGPVQQWQATIER